MDLRVAAVEVVDNLLDRGHRRRLVREAEELEFHHAAVATGRVAGRATGGECGDRGRHGEAC
jgi:hypothetical protein